MTLGYADAMQALVLNVHGLPDGESARVVVEDYDLLSPDALAKTLYDRTSAALRDGTAKGERRWATVANDGALWYGVFKQMPRPRYAHWAQRSAA